MIRGLKLLTLSITAVAATSEPAATGTDGLSATGAAAELTPAITLITDAITKTNAASAKEARLCKEEQDATILWDQTVNTPESRAEAKGNREARLAAKKELAGALANRLKVLQDFLEKLYKSRQRLGGHIHRVNDMFSTVYGANTQTQVNAAETIKLLGISVSQPHSPMFKPIKLPKHEMEADAAEASKLENDPDTSTATNEVSEPEAVTPEVPAPTSGDESTVIADNTAESSTTEEAATAAEAAEEASEQKAAILETKNVDENAPADVKDEQLADATDLAEAAASSSDQAGSLMELESKINGCEGKDCNEAYTAAFALYKTTYLVNKANVEHFENERKALGGFRDGLKALIKKKEDKMAALAAQLKALEASMANPGPTLESLFKMIKQHYDVSKKSCSLMAGRSKTMVTLLSDPNNEGFLELIKAGKVDCQGENAPVDTSASDAAAAAAAKDATHLASETVEPIEDVKPEEAPTGTTDEVPDVKEDASLEKVSATSIPEPPMNGENTEIVNIESKADANDKGTEILDAQV
jgi:hypothetical protein